MITADIAIRVVVSGMPIMDDPKVQDNAFSLVLNALTQGLCEPYHCIPVPEYGVIKIARAETSHEVEAEREEKGMEQV